MRHMTYLSPVGPLLLESDGQQLTRIYFPHQQPGSLCSGSDPILLLASQQLDAFFSGASLSSPLPLAPKGTPFQQRVWSLISAIPRGETRSYRQLALSLGNPKLAQAVGQACGANPIPFLIPCHRVIAADGSLSGYAGGSALKGTLLALEGVSILGK